MRKQVHSPPDSEAVIQNLIDAGCDDKLVEEFLSLEESGQTGKQLTLLSKHRQKLLDRVHVEERRIYCLDYLVCEIQKQQKKN